MYMLLPCTHATLTWDQISASTRKRPTGVLEVSRVVVPPQAPALKPRVNRLSAVPSLARHTTWITSSLVATTCGAVIVAVPVTTCSAAPQAVPFQRLTIRVCVVPLTSRHMTALVPQELMVPAASATVPPAVTTSCAGGQVKEVPAPSHMPRAA